MYDRILIPTDGSQGAGRAVDEGLDIAAADGAEVHVLFVVDESDPAAGHWDVVVERQEAAGADALEAVEQAGEDVGVSVVKHLRRGVPHEEILDAAAAYGVDLVVMGTHGRTGLDRVIHTGSVTERVVRRSDVPVLTVRRSS